MSKPIYKVYKERARQREITAQTEIPQLESYWERRKTKLARAIGDQDLVHYTREGQFEVNRKEVHEATNRLFQGSRYENTNAGRAEITANIADKYGITEVAASRKINKDRATQAEAILLSADIGRVSLSTPMRTRLEAIAAGQYLDKKRVEYVGAHTRRQHDEYAETMKQERAADFRQNVKQRGTPTKNRTEITPLRNDLAAPAPVPSPTKAAPFKSELRPAEPDNSSPFKKAIPRPEAPAQDRQQQPRPEAIHHARENPFKKAIPAPTAPPTKSDYVTPGLSHKPEPSTQIAVLPAPADDGIQRDMFGAPIRSKSKKADQPRPMEMFKANEVLQFGVKAHNETLYNPKTKLALQSEDHRTQDERDRDTQREAEKKNRSLF